MKKSDFKNEFMNPSGKYRSIPFWAWNDVLDKKEIARQINEMKKIGMGGFFIHSRDGLETEYMSDEWFECVRTAVHEAKKNKMSVWLYDEDRWPSGTCGGLITKKKENCCKGLTLEVYNGELKEFKDNILALYAAEISGMDIYSLKRLNNIELNDNEVLLIARLEISEGSEWFNYSAPPDNLNYDTVSEFIQSTHEVYKREVGNEFGKTIVGIFTDEPSLADRHALFNPKRGWIPWTDGFEKYFKDMYAEDVFDLIPYLYFNGKYSRKIRHDYWQAISKRFRESYFNRIGEWSKNNNLAFTGHLLQEDKMGLSCRVNGSVMPHYLAQDVPAIDMLTECTEEYITVKQCSSAASQMGADMVLTETYGCTGWDLSFEGQKWIGDWQYVLGINQRCQHLALYSLRGCRKRDYPPSINCNNSWWSCGKTIEDYFARLGYMLRTGKAVRKLLVIHPMSTVWSKMGCNPYGNPKRSMERDIPSVNELGNRYNALIKKLCQNHYDCDLGDELIIQEHGKCCGKEFYIGKCKYDTIIVPFCENLLSSTIAKLSEFMDNGGKIIALAPFTMYVDGIKKELPAYKNLIKKYTEQELLNFMESNIKRLVSITNADNKEEESILYQLRHDSDGYILFIVNNDRYNDKNVKVKVEAKGKVYSLNLLTGAVMNVDYTFKNGSTSFCCYMRGCGSEMFYITHDELCSNKAGCKLGNKKQVPITLKGMKNDTENVLVLDKCRFIMNKERSDIMEVWKAQYEIRSRLNMRQIHRNGIEQRYRWIKRPHKNDNTLVELVFEFESLTDISSACLVIERPECFKIRLDDREIDNTVLGYFFDKSFKKIKLPYIVMGKHSLILQCGYTNDMELENIYIIGDFLVDNNRCIKSKTDNIRLGDICKMGYMHYAGGMEYIFICCIDTLKNKKIYLDVKEFKGICAEAEINGFKKAVPWKADSIIEVSDYLKQGENIIKIKIFMGLKNMLGPLHITNKPQVTNDSCFSPMGDNYTEAYVISEAGLFKCELYSVTA